MFRSKILSTCSFTLLHSGYRDNCRLLIGKAGSFQRLEQVLEVPPRSVKSSLEICNEIEKVNDRWVQVKDLKERSLTEPA